MEPNGYAFDSGDEPYVFSTVRWDPNLVHVAENTKASCNRPCPFYMLEHHWTRLQVAKWSVSLERSSPAELFHTLQSAVQHWHAKHPNERPEALRVKHRVFSGGRSYTDILPAPRLPMETLFPTTFGTPPYDQEPEWLIFLDNEPTEATAVTMYKTSDRACYERARRLAGIKTFYEKKEVMLYNTDDDILDGSISTPYFWRKGRWVTPPSWSGGQQGTTRRWALMKGLAVEEAVRKDDVKDGEIVWLSNGSRGFFRARFVSAKNLDGS
jgi:4-amino-4-deoxychorismate lyase